MMSVRQEINYKGFDGDWSMDIYWNNTIKITYNPEGDGFGPGEREYDIPEDITGIEHNTEYVWLTLKDKRMIQFKFEIDGAIIANIFDDECNFLDTFASYSFWDNIEIL